jgi:hypothetical protein
MSKTFSYGSTRGNPDGNFHNRSNTPLTFGNTITVGPASDIYHGTQTRQEFGDAKTEMRREAAGAKWNVFKARDENGMILKRTDSDDQLEIALRNAKLNGNNLSVCDMGKCVVYALTAAGAAFVLAKLTGAFGGKKSRTKRRNKSKRNKPKRNKSKKNKRRSIRRR